jgi:ribosomal protein S18 acetylase RimI-like enzyme
VSTDRFVRSARAEDVEAVVGVQVAAWAAVYGDRLPAGALAEMTGAEARERFAAQWRAAVEHPPSSRHRVLVATEERAVAGFAAVAPAGDPDLWPGTDAEILALHVLPDRARRGHGSRLLNAVVDHLVDDGFRTAVVWVAESDDPLRPFLEATGWRADGARRELDLGRPLPMVRLHAAIAG